MFLNIHTQNSVYAEVRGDISQLRDQLAVQVIFQDLVR